MRDPCLEGMTSPLAEHADGFRAELAARGYVQGAAACQLQLMADLSGWLAARGLGPSELARTVRVDEFLQARRVEGHRTLLSRRALTPLIAYLTRQGVVPAASLAIGSPTEALLEEYRRCLVDEQGLKKNTVASYLGAARLFLSECGYLNGAGLEQLSAAQVTGFVVEQCRRRRCGAAKVLVTGLRSLLRFLFVAGYTSHQLAGAVPTPSSFSGSSLPRPLDSQAVAALLGNCDRNRALGRRDFAILTVLARLCLRASEVAALELDDLDWHRGEVVIRGKGGRRDRLPLPVDVGEALIAYLCDGRPVLGCRVLFLRAHAPIGGLSPEGVAGVVRSACTRAGVAPVGPHRLRHHGASAMLQGGATLAEVGQALRHRDAVTTAVYAKVDRVALRALAQRWPGGVQ